MADSTVTVTGLTADRMLQIEAESVVDGTVVGDNLILVRRDGAEIVAGNVRGPAGTGGGGTGSTFVYEQSFVTANNHWVVLHNGGTKAVSILTLDANGDEIEGDVTYFSDNEIHVDFYHPQTGYARVWN